MNLLHFLRARFGVERSVTPVPTLSSRVGAALGSEPCRCGRAPVVGRTGHCYACNDRFLDMLNDESRQRAVVNCEQLDGDDPAWL